MKKIFLLITIFLIVIFSVETFAEKKEEFTSAEWAKKAKNSYDLRDFDKALMYSNFALELDPNNVEACRVVAEIRIFRRDNDDEALKVLKKIIELEPNDFRAYENLYVVYNQKGDYKTAYSFLEKAIEVNPKFLNGYRKMAFNKAVIENDFDKASELIGKVIEFEPDNAANYIDKSNYLLKAKKYEEALLYSEKAIKINPQSPLGYSNKALIYLEICPEKALIFITKAITLEDKKNNLSDFYRMRGDLYYKLESYEKALHDYNIAIESNSENIFLFEIVFAKGKALSKLGKKQEALEAFEYVLNYTKNSKLTDIIEETKREINKLNMN